MKAAIVLICKYPDLMTRNIRDPFSRRERRYPIRIDVRHGEDTLDAAVTAPMVEYVAPYAADPDSRRM
jgi:hypothetical protein